MGPMAQDFRAAFGLGVNDTSIVTVDADGVALAAIQGLNERVVALEVDNRALRARLERLEARSEPVAHASVAPSRPFEVLGLGLGLGAALAARRKRPPNTGHTRAS